MRLASFRHAGRETYGVVQDTGVIDAGARFAGRWPDLKSVLAASAEAELGGLVSGLAPDLPLEAIDWLPVIPNPSKILCIGLNYKEHAAEVGRPIEDKPVVFIRFADTQVGHKQPIVVPKVSEKVDYEVELAVIVGRGGRAIPTADAMAHVAGYAIYNDVSVRDWQRHTHQYGPGKNFPSTGPFGPWMVTSDTVPNVEALRLRTRVNGVTVQDGCLSDLIFPIPDLIAYLSTFTPLGPGDVILTGTPSGVGAMRKPPLWLKAGDCVEMDIDGIGTLINPVINEA